MKKITALLLALLMMCNVFAVAASAEGEEVYEKCPIIFVAGSSVDICDAEGNVIPTGFDVLTEGGNALEGSSTDALIESALNIFLPFFMKGLPDDEWDDYGNALYEELAPIWDTTQLGGDGNAKYGTGVAQAEMDHWLNRAKTHNPSKFNYYGDYHFRYDWRLSPYDEVDRLHEYIKEVIKTTGIPQVSLMGRCLGGNILTAYLDKYGSEGLIKKVVYDEVMSNGSSTINDCFSGQIDINDKHVQSYLLVSEYYGKMDVGVDLAGINTLVLEIVERSFDLITQLGVTDTLLDSVEDLYARLYKAFIPAILKATGIGTWASYWTSVCDKDFDTALNLIFGEEGSEERAEYAGLVDKILYLRERIVKPRELEGEANLYKRFEKDYGVEFAVLAGYGLPIPPLGVHHDDTGDIVVDTRSASFGATTAGLYDTLSQEYIDERVALGYGEYISLDGKIDASTCIFPETTWFIKNHHHDVLSHAGLGSIVNYFTQYTNVTASSNNKNIARFLVDVGDKSGRFTNMTEENMNDAPWILEVEQKPTLQTKLAALLRFITSLLRILTQLIEGSFSLTV